jgi:hypothetical protein
MTRGCASAEVGKNAIADPTSKINEATFRTVFPCSMHAILRGLLRYGQSSGTFRQCDNRDNTTGRRLRKPGHTATRLDSGSYWTIKFVRTQPRECAERFYCSGTVATGHRRPSNRTACTATRISRRTYPAALAANRSHSEPPHCLDQAFSRKLGGTRLPLVVVACFMRAVRCSYRGWCAESPRGHSSA